MKAKFILAGVLACMGIATQAQDVKTEEPKGKAIVQMFGNFHTGFGENIKDLGFELERSYLGYEYKLNSNISVKGVMDIGKSSDVMYLGELVEYGDTETMFNNPSDERTRAYLTGKMG